MTGDPARQQTPARPIDPAEVAEFETAFIAAFNPTAVGPWNFPTLIAYGLQITWLHEWAALLPVAMARWGVEADEVQDLTVSLVDTWDNAGPLDPDLLAAWMLVLHGAPDYNSAANLTYNFPGEATAAADTGPNSWSRLAPMHGAVGYAAGVRPADAAAMPIGDLAAMAALRGWMLPPAAGEGE